MCPPITRLTAQIAVDSGMCYRFWPVGGAIRGISVDMMESKMDPDDKPDHFYKYKGYDQYTERMFTHRELYFPCAAEFNDPLDCATPVTLQGGTSDDYRVLFELIAPPMLEQAGHHFTDAELATAIEEMHRETMSDLPKFNRDFTRGVDWDVRNNHGILCMSEINDNLLMWSHYSDKHRGFCLRFPTDGIFNNSWKVNYTSTFPTINYFQHSLDELTRMVLLTKADVWSYEQEWRILQRNIKPGLRTFKDPDFVTGVIFGALMPDDQKQNIRTWMDQGGFQVQFYQCHFADQAYALNIVPVD